MNIAIMLPTLSGGGAERVASIVGNYYIDQGHQVYYFLGNYGLRNVYKVNGKIVRTDINFVMGQKSGNFFNFVRSIKIIKDLKKKYKIDVAISFMEEFNYLNIFSKGNEQVIIRVCRILSKSDDVASAYLNKNILKFVYNRADKIIVMSNYAMKEMRYIYGIKKEKLCKIPNPVSIYNNVEIQSESEWKYGEKVILCVGRCVDVKQHNVSIKAFKWLSEYDKSAEMIILGEGGNKGKIKKMINDSGLKNRIHYLGFQQNVYYYMKHSKIFLMNSKSEGFPNAMLEAMNAGLAIVTTDCPGGPPDIVGKTEKSEKYCPYGILAPYITDDNYEISKISTQEEKLGTILLGLLQDSQLLNEYQKKAKKRSCAYSIDVVMKQWNKIMYNN